MDQSVQESYYTAQMLEDVPVAIALLDARDFHLITANRSFRALFANSVMEGKSAGNRAEERDALDFFSAPTFPFIQDLFRSVIQSGQTYAGQEFPVLHPERGMTYWNGSVTPVHAANGELIQLLIVASDVTEQAKARLQAESTQNEQRKIDTEIQRLGAMEAVARGVSRELVGEHIARAACEALAETLDPLCVCMHITRPAAQELSLAHMYIDEDDPAAESLRQMGADLRKIAYDSPHWIARARHYHEPILLHDLHTMPRPSAEQADQASSTGGYVCIPLWFKEHLEGTLVVFFREALTANALLVRILMDCCTCISAALAHSRLLAEVERERVRLRSVLEHMPEGIFLIEAADQCISYANAAAERILDTPRASLEGMAVEQLYAFSQHYFHLTHDGQSRSDENIPLRRTLAGETIIGEEVQFISASGSLITLLIAIAPIWNEVGTITGAVSIFQDITERKSIEQQKSEFLSIASHELRTPTTAIQGFAEILHLFSRQNASFVGQPAGQIVEDILEQSTRLTRLINSLLDISSIEHHQLPLDRASHDLLATVKRARANIASMDRRRSIVLICEGIGTDEVLPADFDEERLLQVMHTLLSNAMKYSAPDREIEIGVRYKREQPENVCFWVRDSGIGIPSGDLAHIFERFHRSRNADRSTSGLGIGLYLAREIILRHNGSLRAESQEGHGSLFFVELPTGQSDVPPHEGST